MMVKYGRMCPQIFTSLGEKESSRGGDAQPWRTCEIFERPSSFFNVTCINSRTLECDKGLDVSKTSLYKYSKMLESA